VKLTWPRLLLFIVLELLIILLVLCAIHAQEPVGGYGPQVVLTVIDAKGDKRWVVPQATVWFKLEPLGGPTAKAPLSRGDYLLCNDFTMKDQEGGLHVAVRCGEDTYLVEAIGMKVKTETKK
jgi:hypothetical protein